MCPQTHLSYVDCSVKSSSHPSKASFLEHGDPNSLSSLFIWTWIKGPYFAPLWFQRRDLEIGAIQIFFLADWFLELDWASLMDQIELKQSSSPYEEDCSSNNYIPYMETAKPYSAQPYRHPGDVGFQVSWSWDNEHHSWQTTQEGVLCASIFVAAIKLISYLSNFTLLGVCNVFLVLFFCLGNILSRTLL